jgi:transposase
MTYPIKFRIHILELQQAEGLTDAEASKRFNIGTASLLRWRRKLEPAQHRNRVGLKIDREALLKDIEEHPDAYQYERAQRFGVTPQGIAQALKRLSVTRKKNATAS